MEWWSVLIAPSLELITQYLACVFGYLDGWIALRSYPESGQSGKPAMQWVSTDEEYAEVTHQFAITAHEAGRACYVIPGTVLAQGKASSADVTAFGSILVDIDSGDTEAKLTHLTQHIGQPSMVIESGGITEANTTKMHCYWKLSEPAEGDDIQLVLRLRELTALKAGGDTHFKSAHQPIRIAGSIYHKVGEPKLVTIRDHCNTEYHLGDLIEAVDEMSVMEGVTPPTKQASLNWRDFNDAHKPSVGEVLTTTVHEGGTDAWTRFEAISTAIGYFLRRYHEGLLTWDETWEEISAFNQMKVSPPWDQLRLKREVDRLWKKHCVKNGAPQPYNPPKPESQPDNRFDFTYFDIGDAVDNPTGIQPDIIAPRILTERGIALFGGAPKVGKTDFLLNLFIHAAAGEEFLFMQPRGPLRIFYLQVEISEAYMRERVQRLRISETTRQKAWHNLVITPRFDELAITEENLPWLAEHIRGAFGKTPPDIVCIDPIRNVLDYRRFKENDNSSMIDFLKMMRKLQALINPNCCIVLVHHTNKTPKDATRENPFNALAGAGSIRGYYDTGIILFKSEESSPERDLFFELRNGPEPDASVVFKDSNGAWQYRSKLNGRLFGENQGRKQDAERARKHNYLLHFLYEEAQEGRLHTARGMADQLDGTGGLGSSASIRKRLKSLLAKQHLQLTQDYTAYQLPRYATRSEGYLVTEGMEFPLPDDQFTPVEPTHYKDPNLDGALPVQTIHWPNYEELEYVQKEDE